MKGTETDASETGRTVAGTTNRAVDDVKGVRTWIRKVVAARGFAK
jgi:hypothetical protein